MKTETPQTIYLKDYTPPAYLVDTVVLDVDIHTRQHHRHRHPGLSPQSLGRRGRPGAGWRHRAVSVAIDGRTLAAGEYTVAAEA